MALAPGYGETPLDPEEADALTAQARELLGDDPSKADLYEAEQAVLVFLAAQGDESLESYDWAVDKDRYIALEREYDQTRDPRPLATFIPVIPIA